MMTKTLLRVYDNLADGENAREALLRAGFPQTAIHVTVNHDEAGAVEGNFCVGNARTATGPTGPISRFFDALISGESTQEDYDQNYANVVQRGNCILTVKVQNEEQLAQAKDVTSKFNPHWTDVSQEFQ
jgi:hypothetical protein